VRLAQPLEGPPSASQSPPLLIHSRLPAGSGGVGPTAGSGGVGLQRGPRGMSARLRLGSTL
jgi:hypothetical protein